MTQTHVHGQVLLAAIDTSVVTANYAIIGTDLGELNLVSWIATAYVALLMFCSVCLSED